MNQHQREHLATVMSYLSEPARWLAGSPQDRLIGESWQRCADRHGLQPGRMQEAHILPSHQLREHRQSMEEFRHIAHYGLAALYRQIAATGYVLLLTDASGTAVEYLGEADAETSLRRAGLFLGAQWTEASAGTCAVGTALVTGLALTVHQTDHFDATHIPLTCSAVPLFDSQGQLHAVLDLSALRSPQPRESQQLVLQMAKLYARQIEQAWFEHVHRGDWRLRLSPDAAFVGVSPDFLIAFDDDGRLVGHNHSAQQMLEREAGLPPSAPHSKSALHGMPIEGLLDTRLDRLPQWLKGSRQATLQRAGGETLYVTAAEPARRLRRAAPSRAESLPAPLAALCGGDPALSQQLQRAARLLNASLNLVVHGETGCGKEYFSRAFHQASARRGGPFIAVNCAAIPAQLIESELFGHLPGSFSGAGSRARRGLIQEADGGTLFLDEIGDMPLEMQTRLLRVLAEKEVLPVGGSRPVKVDIRVIAASHHALDRLVEQGCFRADLYWRLQGARVSLPALRDRSDLAWLVDKLLAGRAELTATARRALLQHRWPGNLRELSHALEYACALCLNERIEEDDLPDTLRPNGTLADCPPILARSGYVQPDPDESSAQARELTRLLQAARWNHSAVARQLGISRMTLYRRMQRYDIRSPLAEN